MKYILGIALLNLLTLSLKAQENNPLMNSGELINKAISLHDSRKYNEAIALYRKIPESDTNYYRGLYEMALSQMLDSQFVAARNTCETALAKPNDKWPELMTVYGNLIDDMGDSERALRIYDSAIHLYPATSELHLNKGTTLLKLERFTEAEEVFKQCILINPYQGSAHYKLGYVAMQQGMIVQAFLSYANYLFLQPSGRFKANSITFLSAISKGSDEIREFVRKRKDGVGDHFQVQEKILLSKIALDKQYKLLLKLEDPITRQIQVLFEKLEYDESSDDFWMQYYVPFFEKIFAEKKIEPFVYRLFADLDIDVIKDYVKKNKKKLEEVVDEAVNYYDQIRVTREIKYTVRKNMPTLYHFSSGRFVGKGTTINNGGKLTGDWEFYFSAGNVRSKGKYNDNGERTGEWKYYHFDGSLRGKQLFTNDKLNGQEIFYYDNGITSNISNYVDALTLSKKGGAVEEHGHGHGALGHGHAPAGAHVSSTH
jgi:tetratricopeptide (TPR) repeat protein